MSDHQKNLTLSDAPWLSSRGVQDVFRALEASGEETRIVGGAVRNALMGIPVTDIDMATTLLPDEVVERAERAGLRAIPTGIDHGTITIVSSGETIEVTTLRADTNTDGRHADVVFGRDWAGDAARRDFTVNALYCSAEGRIFDPLGGMKDIEARRIRFIGDANHRIREDYLRILRFLRFHGAYGTGTIDGTGLQAIVRARHGLYQLSRERIWSEFSRILELENARPVITLMFDHGLLVDVLRGVPRLKRFENLLQNEKHVRAAADGIRRLGALANFVEDDAKRIGESFRLSRRQIKRLHHIGRIRPDMNVVLDDRSLKRLLYREGRGCVEDLILVNFPNDAMRDEQNRLRTMINLVHDWTPPEFPIRGEDILERGFEPGAEIGRLLFELEDWWVNADFKPDRNALLARMRDLMSEPGS